MPKIPVDLLDDTLRDDGAKNADSLIDKLNGSPEESPEDSSVEESSEDVDPDAVIFHTQAEFDRVIGKRIEQERKKWLRENHTLLTLGKRALARYEAEDEDEAINRADIEYYQHLADKLDISLQAAEYIANLEKANQHANEDYSLSQATNDDTSDNDKPPSINRLSTQQLKELFEEEEVIKETMPEFDIVEFVKQNPMVSYLIAAGYPLSEIVDQFSGELRINQAKKQAEDDVVERIRRRNSRPSSIGGYGTSGMAQSVRTMSDEQIEKIDKAVRAGKRVVL